jgi:predicted molibdopterin-dependent oxidoreductase YjgC
VQVTIDGEAAQAFEGQSVAAVLLAAGRRSWRVTGHGQPRGMFCGMGVCFDCLVRVDGQPNQRACQVFVRDGMRIQTQHDPASWEGSA